MLSRILKLTAIALIFLISNANAQTQQWITPYQGIVQNSYDIAYSIALDPTTGNSFVTGFSGNPILDYASLGYDVNGKGIVGHYLSPVNSLTRI